MKRIATIIFTLFLLVGCGNETKESVDKDQESTVEVSEDVNSNEAEVAQQEIEEIEFIKFEDNKEAQEIADGAILGDDPVMQASFATMYLNHSYDGMFEFEENNEEKKIVGYPINERLEERIEDFKNGDMEAKQAFYDTFSEVDFQFLGVLHGIDDDYEIQILDERGSENKLIIFGKDGYLHNSFAN